MAEEEAAAVAPESEGAIKLLVSNREAGCLIGKGGSNIVNLQTKFGCRVRVSKNDEFFPARQERVVLITGPFSSVSECLSSILHNMFHGFPEPADEGADSSKKPQSGPAETKMITLAIPALAAGSIIGRGGANIKLISTKAGAHLQLASKDGQIPGLSERLLHITGSCDTVAAASRIILEKLGEDDTYRYELMTTSYRHLAAFISRPFPMLAQLPPGRAMPPMMHYPTPLPPTPADRRGPPRPGPYVGGGRGAHAGYLVNPGVAMGGGGPGGGAVGGGGDVEPSTLTMNLPDACVAAVVGRGGAAIQSIQSHTGARVHLSGRGEFVAGTRDHRLVTITGPTYQQTHAALLMISERAGIPFHAHMPM